MSYNHKDIQAIIEKAIEENDAGTLRDIFHVKRIRDVYFHLSRFDCENLSPEVFRLCMETPHICNSKWGRFENLDSKHYAEVQRQKRIHPHVEALHEHLTLMDAIADLNQTIALLSEGTSDITSVLEEKFRADLKDLERKEREFCAQDYKAKRHEQLRALFDETLAPDTDFSDPGFVFEMELHHVRNCSFDTLKRIAELVEFPRLSNLLDGDWNEHFLCAIKETRTILERRLALTPKVDCSQFSVVQVPIPAHVI